MLLCSPSLCIDGSGLLCLRAAAQWLPAGPSPSPNNDTVIGSDARRGGVPARANRTVSLASEPAEELIKGWDCRLEREVVSASRAPSSVSIITALNAGKISTLLAPTSTLPDHGGTIPMYLIAC